MVLLHFFKNYNNFPKQIKSSTNPGGVGHSWVKARFVDPSESSVAFVGEGDMTRVFLPSLLCDNDFLNKSDPSYRLRLEALPEREKKALLYGDWNIFEGQYFTEFSTKAHVCEPFEIPVSWRKYRTIDYGLDRLAVLWIAVSEDGCAYVYREYCESGLPISAAARAITDRTPMGEDIYATLAPPDLFSRTQESGKTKAGIFHEFGVTFTKTSNDRECGWLAIKELLCDTGSGVRLKIFKSCTEIIKCLPALTIDKIRPTDCSNEPHEITHAPDALRGFAIFHTRPNKQGESKRYSKWTKDMWEDYNTADEGGKKYLKQKYGEPK